MVSLLTLLYVLQCCNGLIADIVVCAPWFTPAFTPITITPINGFYILLNSMVHSSVHPIKCFYILWTQMSVFNVAMVSWLTLLYVLRSPHKMFFNILGNCYKMCPIKCFYILCSVSNVAMVSLLTLLYVLRSFHKMFFNILGNCYKMCPIKCFLHFMLGLHCRHGLMADIVVCSAFIP